MVERKVGIVLNYLSLGLNAVVGFIYVPILLFFIGKNEYGLYQLIGSLIAYFSIMDFGLSGAIIRFYTKAKAVGDTITMETIMAMAMRAYGVIAIIMTVVGILMYQKLPWMFSKNMTGDEIAIIQSLFILLIINVIFTVMGTPFRAVITAHQRFIFLKTLDITQLIVQPLLVIGLLHMYPSAVMVALVQTGCNLLGIICRAYYACKILKTRAVLHHWDRTLIHGFATLAISLFMVAVIDQIFFKTSQIILGVVQGAGSVAVYAIAATIYMNYMNLSTAVSGVYLPHVTELIAKQRPVSEISDLFISVGRWQCYLLGFILSAFFLVGKFFIHKWAGPSLEEAYYIALIVMIPFTVDLIQNVGLAILQGYNRYGFRAKVYWGIGIFNVLVSVPMAIHYGAIGCAITTGLSMIISNGFIMNWYYKAKIHLDIGRFWREIIRISMPLIIVTGIFFGILHIYPVNSIMRFIMFLIIYAICYIATLWMGAFSPKEKQKIMVIVQKLK